MFHGLATFAPLSGGAKLVESPTRAAPLLEASVPQALPRFVAVDGSGAASTSAGVPLTSPVPPQFPVSVAKADAAGGLVSRVRNRLFPARAAQTVDLAGDVADTKKRGVGFQASIAELLLINRLKALGRRDQSAEIMERASHIVFVTCQNWFTEPEAKVRSLPHKIRV